MTVAPTTDRSPVVAPIQLGCCRESPRCLLCPPPPPLPDAGFVEAMLEHYGARGDVDLRAAFHGGPPPTDAMLAALRGRPFTARVRPDLLTRERAAELVARGAARIELDALTLDDAALKSAMRPYTGARVLEMLRGLRELGVEVGVVLAPGLPGTTHATAVADAIAVAPLVDTARLHPVQVLEDSRLQAHHVEGSYVPLTLGQAVTTCRAMMDILEDAGVTVIRVGVQAGPDELGRALAGPRHPSLRELVEATRFKDRLRTLLAGAAPGDDVVVRCAAPDETRARGPLNQNLRDLRAELGLASLRVSPDPALARGRIEVELGVRT